MAFAYETAPGAWTEIAGPFEIAGQGYPYNWPDLATEEERAALGIAAIAEPAAPDPGLVVTGSTIEDAGGVPTRVWVTETAPAASLVTQVNAERDRRIEGGFELNGKTFQTRQSDRENIATMGVQAQLAVLGGAAPGDLRWADAANDFVWITADNSTVALDAQGMVELFQRGVSFKIALTFTARAKKDWLLDAARTEQDLADYDPAADWPS